MSQEVRREAAEKSREMILLLCERIATLLLESGATEEEALAALKSAETMTPLLRLESSIRPRYL